MDFLRMLEGLRTPFWNSFFSYITYCGDELVFLVVAITVFWCVSKRDGYYILAVGFLGTICNQTLKLLFRIPRPWVLDPDFTIVESARAAATGYSFPSGHTQNVVGTMTCLLLTTKKTWLRAAAVALMVLVPFSRMYLGCHTPLDVGVSYVLALALAICLLPVLKKTDETPQVLDRLLLVLLTVGQLYLAFVTYYPFPADVDADNLQSGVKNAYTLFGSLLGLLAARAIDRRYLRFEVKAVWWAQILKAVLGLALLLSLKAGLKPLLLAALPAYPADAVRYGLVVLFAAAGWPATFPWFSRLGAGRGRSV
ncbi:MAG: phosphatase PAP2 family protein [Oscillospiraceae bacterium]|nr:phosphatase PAP2 family protein [Oscillospiraceae bacterium]